MLVSKFYAEVWLVLLSMLSVEGERSTGTIFRKMKPLAEMLGFSNRRPGNIANVMEVLVELGLVREGKKVPAGKAERHWGRTKEANRLLGLVRAALSPAVKMTPHHWGRLDRYNGESVSFGRLCRAIERVVVLGLLDGRTLSRKQLLNGLGWICGPSFDSELLGKVHLSPLKRRGFVLFDDQQVLLTSAGKEHLEFLRQVLYVNNLLILQVSEGWDSVLDRLDQAPSGRNSPKRVVKLAVVPKPKKAEFREQPARQSPQLAEVISPFYKGNSMLRPYLWMVFGRDGFNPMQRLDKLFPSPREFAEHTRGHQMINELQEGGYLLSEADLLRTTEKGKTLLRQLGAAVAPKLFVLGREAALGDFGNLLRRLSLLKILEMQQGSTVREVSGSMQLLFDSAGEESAARNLLEVMSASAISPVRRFGKSFSLATSGETILNVLRLALREEIAMCALDTFEIVAIPEQEPASSDLALVSEGPNDEGNVSEESLRRFIFG